MSAIFGDNQKQVLVTERVTELLFSENQNFHVSGKVLGNDPAPHKKKQLTIYLLLDSETKAKTWNSGQFISPPKVRRDFELEAPDFATR